VCKDVLMQASDSHNVNVVLVFHPILLYDDGRFLIVIYMLLFSCYYLYLVSIFDVSNVIILYYICCFII
jgi:hypothetical protein